MRSTRVGLLVAFAATPALAQPKAPQATPAPAPAPAAAPADAAGQPTPADLEKAKEHFAKGKTLFDAKDFAKAVEEFKESYRLSKNPLLLYNVGFTLDQLDQRALALFYYQKFVAAVPADNPNVAPAKERIVVLQKAIEEASLGGAPAAGTPAPAAAPAATAGAVEAAPPTKFEHKIVDAAPPGKPVDIAAFIPPGSFQVTLFFRAAGEASFASVAMQPRYNERVGRIPADTTKKAPTVQYYIEVRDAAGQIVERSGKSTSPNLIFIEKDALPKYYADLGDDKSYHQDAEVAAAPASVGLSGQDEPTPGDGWFDAKSSKLGALKWGTTWTAAGAIALSATFYLIAADAGSSLEDEADASANDACPGGPPCRSFSGKQQDLEGRGERFETFANVALITGGVAAVAAGVFWFLDARDVRTGDDRSASIENDSPTLTAAPVLTPDYVGGAALFRF